jgi:hypothetical protein
MSCNVLVNSGRALKYPVVLAGNKKRGAKQHGMDLEAPAAGGAGGDWTTGPAAAAADAADIIGGLP